MRALREVACQRLTVLHPPLVPSTLHDLMAAGTSGEAGFGARLALRSDPLLAVQLLVAAGGMARPDEAAVASLDDGIEVLGHTVVDSLLRTVATVARPLPAPFVESAERLAAHSVAVASMSRRRSERAGIDPDVGWTAGLLHDLGRALLLQAMTRMVRLPSFLSAVAAEGVEVYLDSPSAADLGIEAARQWSLPEPIRSVLHAVAGDPTPSLMADLVLDAEAALAGGINRHRLELPPIEQTRSCWTPLIDEAVAGPVC